MVWVALASNGCAAPVAHGSAHATLKRAEQAPATRVVQRTSHRRKRGAPRVVQTAPALVSEQPTAEACYEALRVAGVAFERIDAASAAGVDEPTRLQGPIGGVEVVTRDKNPRHAILDCRLALALLSWSPSLREAGVTRIEHYSMYREGAHVGGGSHVSGHAHGLAIDAARFQMADGSVLDVLTDWEDREHNAEPCPLRPDETWQSRVLRGLVCDAVAQNLFQIVITPHHDRAHENHVHLERKPEVSWTYVR